MFVTTVLMIGDYFLRGIILVFGIFGGCSITFIVQNERRKKILMTSLIILIILGILCFIHTLSLYVESIRTSLKLIIKCLLLCLGFFLVIGLNNLSAVRKPWGQYFFFLFFLLTYLFAFLLLIFG